MATEQKRGKLLLAAMIRSTKWLVLVALEFVWKGKARVVSSMKMARS